MKESGKERLILTKAYEVAYALFRLSAPMKEADFSERLRSVGAELLSAAVEENYPAAGRTVQVMECLVKFAGDVNLIGSANADLTLREIYALDAAIAERRQASKTDEIDVADIFSKPAISEPKSAIRQSAMEIPIDYQKEESANAEMVTTESAIRQSAILDRIRQSGNCRLKEIQDLFPSVSERTVRYDIQGLLARNLIERVGSNGPSVFYRAAQGM